MALIDQDRILLLLSILQEPDAEKARKKYLEFFELEGLDDQVVHDRFEDLVCEAVMLDEAEVRLDTDIAMTMLVMLRNGIKKQRGGQKNSRYSEWRKRTLISIGKRRKQELIDEGLKATDAHHQAAEEAASIGAERGVKYSPDYIAREMDNRAVRR